ncbi:MAG: NAD(P)H-dependent oxidoreductase [Azoarcus sp.]|jgi:FMN-dependent NADH-azoreductase|nr:NAD(P)H-dependent oxidoreductase [Azoarcus sp.]
MNILHINSSIQGERSHSSRFADLIVERLRSQYPDAKITFRDIGSQPLPLLDPAAVGALFTPADKRTPEQAARVAQGDAIIAELQAADTVVLGIPMYNLGIPVQFKSWIDAIFRAGVTFRYTATGPEGLIKGKKVYVALSRGGVYRDTPLDAHTHYLKTALGFLGMTDLQFVFGEGVSMGEEGLRKANENVIAQVAALKV